MSDNVTQNVTIAGLINQALKVIFDRSSITRLGLQAISTFTLALSFIYLIPFLPSAHFKLQCYMNVDAASKLPGWGNLG